MNSLRSVFKKDELQANKIFQMLLSNEIIKTEGVKVVYNDAKVNAFAKGGE